MGYVILADDLQGLGLEALVVDNGQRESIAHERFGGVVVALDVQGGRGLHRADIVKAKGAIVLGERISRPGPVAEQIAHGVVVLVAGESGERGSARIDTALARGGRVGDPHKLTAEGAQDVYVTLFPVWAIEGHALLVGAGDARQQGVVAVDGQKSSAPRLAKGRRSVAVHEEVPA